MLLMLIRIMNRTLILQTGCYLPRLAQQELREPQELRELRDPQGRREPLGRKGRRVM